MEKKICRSILKSLFISCDTKLMSDFMKSLIKIVPRCKCTLQEAIFHEVVMFWRFIIHLIS